MLKPIKTTIGIAVVGIIVNQTTFAGSFSLYTEGSAAEIGNFAAGVAAEGADASIGYYNPAGLVLLHQKQVVLSGVGVLPSSKLTGTSTYTTEIEGEPFIPPYIQSFSNLQGAKKAVVPALHYAQPLGDRATFGISLYSPFGLSTDWGEESPVRYAGTLTELMTANVSPEIGGRLTEHWAIGAGLDLQWAQVKFNQIIGTPAVSQFLQATGTDITATTLDSLSFNQGHSFGVGAHGGILGMFNENHTRIGLNYQSPIKQQFNGRSILTGRLADTALTDASARFQNDTLTSNEISLPDITTVSIYQDVNTRLALLGSAVYTGWNSFKTIQLNQVAAYSSETSDSVLLNSTAIQDYRNTWRFALGANYHFNNQWMLRVGGGYDQTPTINAHRDIRLPDANRWALSVGGHYQMRPYLGFDLGYTYLWAQDDPIINNTTILDTTSSYHVDATAKVHAQLVGLQAVWTIDYDDSATMK